MQSGLRDVEVVQIVTTRFVWRRGLAYWQFPPSDPNHSQRGCSDGDGDDDDDGSCFCPENVDAMRFSVRL